MLYFGRCSQITRNILTSGLIIDKLVLVMEVVMFVLHFAGRWPDLPEYWSSNIQMCHFREIYAAVGLHAYDNRISRNIIMLCIYNIIHTIMFNKGSLYSTTVEIYFGKLNKSSFKRLLKKPPDYGQSFGKIFHHSPSKVKQKQRNL